MYNCGVNHAIWMQRVFGGGIPVPDVDAFAITYVSFKFKFSDTGSSNDWED